MTDSSPPLDALESSPDLPDIELKIPPKPDYVGLARHVIGATARLGSFRQDAIDNSKLAASEAVTNAVAQAERACSSEPVVIRAEIEGDRLVVTIIDRGAATRGRSAASADGEPDSLDFSFERGLSLPLLEGLVDELEITPREGGGNVLRITVAGIPEPTE